jgi:methylglutaconyl-CoA hydratase
MILTELKERVGYIILNRPEKRNAFSPQLVSELKSAIFQFSKNDSCRVIVLKANGPVFSAGADLAYLQSLQTNSFEENLEDSRHLMNLFNAIYHLNKPVIAQVEGHAIAGGCGLATICDFVFAVPEAKFGYTEVKIGFIPALVSVFLQRKIGDAKCRELLLSGNLYAAEHFANLGLVNQLVHPEKINDFVFEYAKKISNETSGESIALTKQLLAKVSHLPFQEALELAAAENASARATDDCKKGISGFLNKTKVEW